MHLIRRYAVSLCFGLADDLKDFNGQSLCAICHFPLTDDFHNLFQPPVLMMVVMVVMVAVVVMVVVAVKIFHVMIVVFVGLIQDHVKIAGIQPGFHNAADLYLISGNRKAFKGLS